MKGLNVKELLISATGLSIQEYAAVLTGVLTGIFTFDCLWALTRMAIERALAMSMFAAIGAGVLFALFAFKEEADTDDEPSEGSARFVEADGLSVLIQISKRKGKAA